MRFGAVLGRAVIVLVAVGCGDGAGAPNPPALPPGSLVILTGGGQTDTAGATFAVPVSVEVRDTAGSPLAGVPVWFGEAPIVGFFSDGPGDTTDAAGRAELAWRPDGAAGTRRLRAGVFLEDAAHVLHLVAADTISGTVLPASPDRVDLSDPATRLLGEPLDVSTVVGAVHDRYENPVTVTSLAVEAASPFQVNGTLVHSDAEVDDLVNVVINGVPFAYRLMVRRDLRELVGAQGGWVCDKAPGAVTATPGLYIRRRDAQVTVDSVQLREDGEVWTFFFSASWHDQLSDGSTADDAAQYSRLVLLQSPGRWLWEYGPEMVQTGTAPLSYEAIAPDECSAWDSVEGTTPAHQPLHLSK